VPVENNNANKEIVEFLNEKFRGESEEFELGEVVIHQLIETIEFVLGTISNTASYLRLWALSLAHSQLSKVFYDLMMKPAINSGSVLALAVALPFFIGATVGVLLCMDAMECFLHVLRLHWVEFQGRFYKGRGVLFRPLDFAKELEFQT
jgi:V-type H+-transporting ATPase subunit a